MGILEPKFDDGEGEDDDEEQKRKEEEEQKRKEEEEKKRKEEEERKRKEEEERKKKEEEEKKRKEEEEKKRKEEEEKNKDDGNYTAAEELIKKYDKNGDGKLDRREYKAAQYQQYKDALAKIPSPYKAYRNAT